MMKKSGYVSIIGKPNTGKSTLLNRILKVNISAVSKKAQTTRAAVLGIYNDDTSQIIFYDTPGIIKSKNLLEEEMMKDIEKVLKASDIIIYIHDNKNWVDDRIDFKKKKDAVELVVLNKIDLVNQEEANMILDNLREKYSLEVIPVSALTGYNLDKLIDEIKANLPHEILFYPEDIISEKPERFFVAEFVRQVIFETYGQEIPYSTGIIVDEFKERVDGKDYIKIILLVERESQKKILIGEKGKMIKKVGIESRKLIEGFLERSVFLELVVKVSPDWKNKKNIIKKMWDQI